MGDRDARDDWRGFDAGRIPSKRATPHLDRWLDAHPSPAAGAPAPRLLDVGCGTGGLARRLYDRGFSVVGVDINRAAIGLASALAAPADDRGRLLRFVEADVAAFDPPRIDGAPFDVVVCQLVLSIIGGPPERANLLQNLRALLHPGGGLYLSASGVSDTINPGYARLYAEDLPRTGEHATYLSRDERGEVLYMTHHFTAEELAGLVAAAGFGGVRVTTERESSSRRPEEAAYFHYVTAAAR
jgi:SAM-dependent methyltransferase